MSFTRVLALLSVILLGGFVAHADLGPEDGGARPQHEAAEVFEPIDLHVHGGSIAQLPNGDFMACWFEGTGERWADDVLIRGARLRQGESDWSDPFDLANTRGFPDINPVLFVDGQEQLWLLWYTVLANQWETSLPKYRISTNYMMDEGPPEWDWQEVLHVKPGDSTERGIQPGDRFVEAVKRKTDEYTAYLDEIGSFIPGGEDTRGSEAWWNMRVESMLHRAKGKDLVRSGRIYDEDGSYESADLGYPLMRRIGWQTYNKPVILDNGRMIVPLYSDGFWFSLKAITEDWGETWSFSEPIIGNSNIQAATGVGENNRLVTYFRDNGPPPKRMHMSESTDGGETWSPVTYSDLPNPGSGADLVTLRNGHWLMVYNDTESGRHSLAAAISTDEGETWRWRRRLEIDLSEDPTTSHYPAVIQSDDGMIHVVYSHFYNGSPGRNRTIKWARFNEAWVREGEPGFAMRQDVYEDIEDESPGGSHVASITELSDGTLLYSFNGVHYEGPTVETKWGENPPYRAYVSRLEPDADTWTEPELFPRDDAVDIHNTVLWYNGDGKVFMFYTTLEGMDHDDSTLDLITSTDGGRTWSEPRSIRDEWGWMFGTKPIRMSNGEVLLPVYKEEGPGGVGFMVSDDDFETWEVYPEDPNDWPMPGIMAAVVELDDGELMAYLRASRMTLEIRSSDYGRTWTDPEPTDLPNPWARVALIKLDSGNLLMAHNPTPTSPRTPMRLSLSEDGGETWPYWVEVETQLDGRHDYPYLFQASDGRIHLGYSHNDKSNMRHVVFDEDYVRSGQFLFSDPSYSIATFEDGEFTITPR